MARERWGDESIWVSTDHGQMNGQKGNSATATTWKTA